MNCSLPYDLFYISLKPYLEIFVAVQCIPVQDGPFLLLKISIPKQLKSFMLLENCPFYIKLLFKSYTFKSYTSTQFF